MSPRFKFLAPLAVLSTVVAVVGSDHVAKADPSSTTGVMGDSTGDVDVGLGGGAAIDGALATTNLATGAMRSSIRIEVPPARGAVQPRVGLTYDSSAGLGWAGVGWTMPLPSIVRHNLAGPPTYVVGSNGLDLDRFEYMGQPLVPICVVPTNCQEANPFPDWANGARLYRLEVDDVHARFFMLDASTWRIQLTNGEVIQLGRSPSGDMGAVDLDPGAPTPSAFRWNIAQDTDANGNAVVYQWAKKGPLGLGYLTDVFDTLGATGYAHHVHIAWEGHPSAITTPAPVWRSHPEMRISGIDVTSASFTPRTDPSTGTLLRELVRRYHFKYESVSYEDRFRPRYSYLQSVAIEGRCDSGPIAEQSGVLPPWTGCPTLPATPPGFDETPAMAFTYTPEVTRSGAPTLVMMKAVPDIEFDFWNNPTGGPNPLGNDLVVMDANADGRVDIVQHAHSNRPTQYVWLNEQGAALSGRPVANISTTPQNAQAATLQSLLGTDITKNVATVADFSGCGRPSVLWSTPTDAFIYSWTFAGTSAPSLLSWTGQEYSWAYLPLSDSSKMALGSLFGDIDGDGYVDRLRPGPSADGKGTAMYLERTDRLELQGVGQVSPFQGTLRVSNYASPDPFTSGVFSRQLADMNGDGLADLVEVDYSGGKNIDDAVVLSIRYVPGDGSGVFFGADGSLKSTIAVSGTISIYPRGWGLSRAGDLSALYFEDVSGDGIADVVLLAEVDADPGDGITVNQYLSAYLSDGANTITPMGTIGLGTADTLWTGKQQIAFGDADGDGVSDVVLTGYTGAFGEQKYGRVGYVSFAASDPATKVQPGLLAGIDYGVNVHVDVAYATTSSLQDQKGAWKTPMPQVVPLVTSITRTNRVASAATGGGAQKVRDDFTYTDPEYDAWRRTFLGFRTVEVTHSGSSGTTSTPAQHSRTTFLYVNPFDDLSKDCASARSNLHPAAETVQGRPVLEERWQGPGDAPYAYLYTRHIGYAYTRELTSFDGRAIWFAWPYRVDTFLYDTAAFRSGATQMTFADLFPHNDGDPEGISNTYTLASSAYAHLVTFQKEDSAGNEVSFQDYGEVDASLKSKDGIISRTRSWQLPPGDKTGWSYRTTNETVTGDAGGYRSRRFVYDANGNLLEIHADHSGMAPVVRPASGAPLPQSASKPNGDLLQVAYTYDSYGNVRTVRGANDQLTSIDYDPAFSQLSTSATGYLADGSAILVTGTTYDRGFAAPTSMTSANGATSFVSYDGFGRAKVVTKAGATPGTSGAVTTLDYPDPIAGLPVRVHTKTSGPDLSTPMETWSYYDGFGQPILSLQTADTNADHAAWVASGLAVRDYDGHVVRAYKPWFYPGADGGAYPVQSSPDAYSAPSVAVVYDGFGRAVAGTNYEGAVEWKTAFHALSVDAYDADAIASGKPRATTVRDGHGRTVRGITAARDGSDTLMVATTYLATGEPSRIVQSHSADGSYVARSIQYDSLGRMVANTEPNSSVIVGEGVRGWTYAYDDSGDLVATADSRGCGENLAYDALGRLTAEDYSPCDGSLHTDAPEATYSYDRPEDGSAGVYFGRLTAIHDRGAHTQLAYDARGLVTMTRRQIVRPDGSGYAPTWYTKTWAYDSLGREVRETTGANAPELRVQNDSFVAPIYSARGVVQGVRTSYDPVVPGAPTLFSDATFDAAGAATGLTLGDAATTKLAIGYDAEQRLKTYKLARTAAPSLWGQPVKGYTAPTTGSTALDVIDQTFDYDGSERLAQIEDHRNASEWPAGAKPVTRTYGYDGFDRLASVAYTYGNPATATPDIQVAETSSSNPDPVPSRNLSNRVTSQRFAYDWKGNLTFSDDDQSAFYDRSIGRPTYDVNHPNQLVSATGTPRCVGSFCQPQTLSATYDGAGNLTQLLVTRAAATCTSSTGCTHLFIYDWDELGQLVHARRWDYFAGRLAPSSLPAPVPTGAAQVDLSYAYSQGARVLKTAKDAAGAETHSLEIFSTLRLNRAAFSGTDYEDDAKTESVYLGGTARVAYAPNLPSPSGATLHVFYEIGDHLGSTSAVIDRETGEVVQASTYQAYGAPESDFSPDRWSDFREDYRFTGKEDDREVGLTYFGARYYSAALGRWISPDPLWVHGLAGDPNPYAYVGGAPNTAFDPTGLDGQDAQTQEDPPPLDLEGSRIIVNDYQPLVPATPECAGVVPRDNPAEEARNATITDAPAPTNSFSFAAMASALSQAAESAEAWLKNSEALVADAASAASQWSASFNTSGNIGQTAAAAYNATLDADLDFFMVPEVANFAEGGLPASRHYLSRRLDAIHASAPDAFKADASTKTIKVNVYSAVGAAIPAVVAAFLAPQSRAASGVEGVALRAEQAASRGMRAHHIFPQAEALSAAFEAVGIDIDEFRVQVSQATHVDLHTPSPARTGVANLGPGGLWNEAWRQFFLRNPAADQTAIFEHAIDMLIGNRIRYFSPVKP